MKIGQYVKYRKRVFGVVTDVYPDGQCSFVTHNGMKPRHNLAYPKDLEIITKERFTAWIQRNGHTSMWQYVGFHKKG